MAMKITQRHSYFFVACCLSLMGDRSAFAAQNRSAWMWQQPSHPYGSANILGNPAKEAEVLTNMGAWGFDRIYLSTGTRTITDPTTVANWNSSLDDVGLDVQFLISEFGAATEPDRTNLLNKIQSRLIDYNNSRSDPRERFDAVHLDIEPHTTDARDNGSPTDKRELLLELESTYSSVRTLLNQGGQSNVEIFADIPVWYDSSSSIGWSSTVERDQWFQDIAVPLDGLSMMAYERSSLSSIVNGVSYEASNFNGEVRVGLNNKEIGLGDTFEDFDQYMAMVESLDGDLGITIGGVDHHTFYLLAELSPAPVISADFDQDNDVDGADFLALQRGYGMDDSAGVGDGDADGNGTVNLFDLLAWQNQYGTSSLQSLMVVPEPCTLMTLTLMVAYCFAHPSAYAFYSSDWRRMSRPK